MVFEKRRQLPDPLLRVEMGKAPKDKFVFLVSRASFYRFFYSLIDEALSRGHEVELWHDQSRSPQKGSKAYQFVDEKWVPEFISGKPLVRVFKSRESVDQAFQTERTIAAVFNVSLPDTQFNARNVVEKAPFVWATLTTGFDSFHEFKSMPAEASSTAKDNQIFFSYTPAWMNQGLEYLKKFYPEFKDYFSTIETHHVGHPEFDDFKQIDPDEVRKKYGIPADRDVFLYLPFATVNRLPDSQYERAFAGIHCGSLKNANGAFDHSTRSTNLRNLPRRAWDLFKISRDPVARKMLLNGPTETQIFKEVRRFCDRNKLFLVSKPRLKFPVIDIVKDQSDLMLLDEEKECPPALKQLLTVSRVLFTHCSTSFIAATVAGVPSLSTPLRNIQNDAAKFFYDYSEGSIFQFKGVIDQWPDHEVAERLRNLKLPRLDETARAQYCEKFLGKMDFKASSRILSHVERRIAERSSGQGASKHPS